MLVWSVFYLPKFLLLLLVFAYIYILQGSVETYLLFGGMYNNHIIANCPQSVPVPTVYNRLNRSHHMSRLSICQSDDLLVHVQYGFLAQKQKSAETHNWCEHSIPQGMSNWCANFLFKRWRQRSVKYYGCHRNWQLTCFHSVIKCWSSVWTLCWLAWESSILSLSVYGLSVHLIAFLS